MKFKDKSTQAYITKNGYMTNVVKPEELERLTTWCKNNFEKSSKLYDGSTSYGLKHRYEDLENTYVNNEVFKLAMNKAGIKGDANGNTHYYVTAQSVKRLFDLGAMDKPFFGKEFNTTYKLNTKIVNYLKRNNYDVEEYKNKWTSNSK